jgi:3',5'-cyclic AMP phosphodiesterase CpdA
MMSCISCSSNPYVFNINDYTKNLSYSDGYRILQLSDLHYGVTVDFKSEFAYLDKLVTKASPDLIVITGDCFMNANAYTIQTAFNHFGSYNIPWTMVFGNHDTQSISSPRFIIDCLKNAKNSFFVDVNDDTYGNCNFVYNLKSGDETKWQLYFLDSNSYHFNGIDYDYDIIHSDQLVWYDNCIKASNNNLDNPIPSLCFMHIPLFEYKDAYDSIGGKNGLKEGEYVEENFSIGYKNSGFFQKIVDMKSTKGVFCGHDHVNSFAIDYKAITLSYGVKTGDCIYHNAEHMGGQVITLRDDGTFDKIERIFLGYGE